MRAGEIVGRVYDALLKQYHDATPKLSADSISSV